jgi:pimeloyl-ACP methyl ester carboxylesterase
MTTDSPFVPKQHPVHYNTIRVNELDIFYREAGPQNAPTILLLHGFPTSSNMFRNLIPRLATSFHVVAPDYPGFGESSAPDHKSFAYTFETLTNVMEQLVEKLRLKSYSLYVFDYGAPVGYRLALRHPERVQALIVQNGNAYEEGLLEFWDPIKKYWAIQPRRIARASAFSPSRRRRGGSMKTAWPTLIGRESLRESEQWMRLAADGSNPGI